MCALTCHSQPSADGKPCVALGVAPREPRERRAEVVLLGLQARRQLRLAAPAVRICVLGEPQVVVGVALRQLRVARTLLARERPDRLEQVEALAVGADEALRDERRQVVELRAADGLGGVEVEAAGEDAEAREQPPLVLAEQLVAPRDRRPQRLMALRKVDRSTGQQLETLIQA